MNILVRLKKDYDTTRNSVYESQLRGDMKTIENELNKNATELYAHKNHEKAHSSKQIMHGLFTVANRIENVWARLTNLVLNHDGNDVKEVVDIRVATDASIHKTAKDRLDYEFAIMNSRFVYKNALNYDADPTGKNPSAAAIQRALDEIHREGGGQLIIPAGEYLIEKRIVVYENTRVTMAHNCVLLRGWAGGFFINGLPTDNFKGYNGRGNIIIEGGILDGNYANIGKYPTKAMDSIILGHASNIIIDRVIFKDTITAHAIDANGINNLQVTNCKYLGFVDLSPSKNRPYSEAIQLGEFTKAGMDQFGAFDGTPNKNVLVAHNYVGESDLLGAWGCGVGNHYTVYDVYQTNITIFDNNFENCTFAGVRTYKWGEVKILDNKFKNCRDCIRISQAIGGFESSKNAAGKQTNRPQGAQNVLIQGNDFYDYTEYGILTFGQITNKEVAWSDGIRILGNYFRLKAKNIGQHKKEQAIKLVFAKNARITDNRLYGGRRGIWIEGCFNTFVESNEISNMDTEAVFIEKSRDKTSVTKSTHVTVSRNEINSTGRNGIYVQNTDYFDVCDNNIFNTNKEQDKAKGRGGIYVGSGYDGRIENNRIRGVEKSFAILVDAKAREVNVANTKGTGRVIVQGSDNFNGYYGTKKDDYIRKIVTKEA
ncbi:right-handed parallel beta-helix repeat-containing protein [Bacillus sp. 1735sda2]|uniref:right-handed parallel beta-helix repeat-containing protein n=1 Tax=Bacillus sp. 1735sda2 TaxID=2953806 RepID=UPI00209CBE80|nr:right-handed parallel beta-helix repeat-containing protein [Bacillus sp. 1735sda2]MCP1150233.1 right-handed parallel beta-helix repeat-containing protein [Bacillus sp. 1735sda2]